ncbi:MAG: hypothetical protein VYD19_04100, partial [Myxococcota bacterium]|nr:hypothetical protein [Myxococcota bacterium]
QKSIESDLDHLLSNVSPHPLLQLLEQRTGESNHAQLLYRPIHIHKKATREVFPWLCFPFYPDPDSGLLDPFATHRGRFWALFRIHSFRANPLLCCFVSRDIPQSHEAIVPQLRIPFSARKLDRAQQIDQVHFESTLQFYDEDRNPLDPERVEALGGDDLQVRACHVYLKGGKTLQRLQQAKDAPESFMSSTELEAGESAPESWLPDLLSFPGAETVRLREDDDWITEDGPIGWKDFEEEGSEGFYLGSLLFYNQYRTVDRQRLVTFLLNLSSVAAVIRSLDRRVAKVESSVEEE